jgi:D-alanyl-lipoteichoic acid acyltransferase DltB (MBOAT superfamily)
MLFHSAYFGVYFILVFTIFWLIHKWRSPRVFFLLGASYFFYISSEMQAPGMAKYALLIVFQTVSDYFVALALARLERQSIRRLLLWISIVVNLGILAIFKYYNFFADSFAEVCTWAGWHTPLPTLNLLLPVGISFYTFHTLSYTLDVYYRRIQPARNLWEFALAVVFFPQLVAGPIVRASQFLPQLENTPTFDLDRFRSGLLLLFTGLFKKVLIADFLADNLVDDAFKNAGVASGWHLLLATYAYAFQIYCDFSGYSDMAMGVARMLGYELPINFNLPYRACDMRDFWRRWHISLSTFLRDYLYIPLGGSKGTKWFTARNLMITMLLGGLWHGAAWNFVLWGFYHGMLLAIIHFWTFGKQTTTETEEEKAPWRHALQVFFTFHLVCLGWVFFRVQHFSDIGIVLGRILTWAPSASTEVFPHERGIWVLILAAALHYFPIEWFAAVRSWIEERSPALQGAMTAVALGILGVVVSAQHPFIYFQF